jgi:hypothetical protein
MKEINAKINFPGELDLVMYLDLHNEFLDERATIKIRCLILLTLWVKDGLQE